MGLAVNALSKLSSALEDPPIKPAIKTSDLLHEWEHGAEIHCSVGPWSI